MRRNSQPIYEVHLTRPQVMRISSGPLFEQHYLVTGFSSQRSRHEQVADLVIQLTHGVHGSTGFDMKLVRPDSRTFANNLLKTRPSVISEDFERIESLNMVSRPEYRI